MLRPYLSDGMDAPSPSALIMSDVMKRDPSDVGNWTIFATRSDDQGL